MKRDMELIRKVLFALEEREEDVADSVDVDGYTMEQVAYHCSLLHDGGYVKAYKGIYASNHLYCFTVGSLTWDGSELLEKIKNDTVWNKTKDVITKKALPQALDVIKTVATSIVEGMVKVALNP